MVEVVVVDVLPEVVVVVAGVEVVVVMGATLYSLVNVDVYWTAALARATRLRKANMATTYLSRPLRSIPPHYKADSMRWQSNLASHLH